MSPIPFPDASTYLLVKILTLVVAVILWWVVAAHPHIV